MKLVIKDREIELKYGFRALLIYENITDKSFAPQSVTDIVVFLYSVILASDKEINLSFDDFIEIVDENPNMVNEFSEWLSAIFDKQKFISPEEAEKKVDDVKEDSKKK